ncbi:hypothetical protein L6164_010013 [Bauhinia variegata]|uniref:Uncharacterized protein n=1 Tax=Bauhinia variegata TaxID=167791 RepID=A0ACB9PLI6_BAUVA|nr:hypothetical protein L6164_010013 [Bauhinia variegata]
MKLMTMSVTKSSSEWPELKNRESISADSSEAFSWSSWFFSLTMFLANSRTSETATRSCFSDPIFNFFWIFQIMDSGLRNLLVLISVASSNASANLDCSRDGFKYSGWNPKAILQMLSNANRWRMS